MGELQRAQIKRIVAALYAVDRCAEWNGDGQYLVGQKAMAQISEAIDCAESLRSALTPSTEEKRG
jgi:hypothetical protein